MGTEGRGIGGGVGSTGTGVRTLTGLERVMGCKVHS